MTNGTGLSEYAVMAFSLANLFDNQLNCHGPGSVSNLIFTLENKQIPPKTIGNES